MGAMMGIVIFGAVCVLAVLLLFVVSCEVYDGDDF